MLNHGHCYIIIRCLIIILAVVFGINNTNAADRDNIENIQAELTWAEFDGEDYEIFYSNLRDNIWGSKTQITDNNLTDLYPSISSGTNGITWVVWSAVKGINTHLFYSNFDGSSWLPPTQIKTSFSSNTTPSIIIDNENIPWVVWTGFDGQDDDIYFTRWNGSDWDDPQRVNKNDLMPDILPIIGIDEEGSLWVKWSGYDNGKYRHFYSEWRETRWDDEREDMTNSLYNSLIKKALQSIPRLPDFIDETDKASIYIKNHNQLQAIPLRDIENEVMIRKSPKIFYNQIDSPSNQDSNQEIIIGFGDSITKGCPYVEGREGGGRRVGGYEPNLEELYNEFIGPSVVYNWGVGGENTSQGIYRIDDVIESYDHVDYLLILEGVNDLGLWSYKSTIFNLTVMVKRSLNRGAEPILATLTPSPKVAGGLGENIPTEYNPRIEKLAVERGILFSDQYSALIDNWKTLSSDGIHPNRAGYSIMANTWFKALSKPIVTTADASSIRETSVLLNGLVNPHGQQTTYYFEYGLTKNYGTNTAIMDAGSGPSEIAVRVDLTGLTGETTYHYRLVAKNSYGKSYGNDIPFTTSNGIATTLEASLIGVISATLNGLVNPKGYKATYYFEYGTTTAYGATTPCEDAGSGNIEIAVSSDLKVLSPDTTYHFRLVVTQNTHGTYGEDLTFKTYKGSGSSGGGCFIATAAFGSSLGPHVKILKDFRDKYLLTNAWGREFVEFYYMASPSIADRIANNGPLKIMVRMCLYPLVGFSYVMLNTSLEMRFFVVGFFILFVICFIVLLRWVRCKNTM